MTESATPSAWIAAGVQHAVLSRTMPALRHELAGSVSVLRMGLAVVKRKLELTTDPMVDCDAMSQRVESLESGIMDLSQSLRRLRHWDKPADEMLSLRALVSEVWELARPFLALRNIEPAELPDEHAAWSDEPVRPQPLMYMLLACIYHLAEGSGHTPRRLMLTVKGARLQVSGDTGDTSEGLAAASTEPARAISSTLQTPPIDRFALQCLAESLHGRIEFSADQTVSLQAG